MHKLYYFYYEKMYGMLFIDGIANYVGYIHENDGCYNKEYLDFIPKYFGVEINEILVNKLKNPNNYDYDPEIFIKKNKKQILLSIKLYESNSNNSN